MEETIFEGIVEKIIYKNTYNGYVVLNTKTTENKNLTVVGFMSNIKVGENFKAKGTFQNHSNFGKQFCIKSFEIIPPTTKESILKYLSSGALKGIGPSKAEKIVKVFGKKSLEIIEKDSLRLVSIKGITKKIAEKISKEFKESFELRKAIIELSKFQITTSEVVKAYSEFGKNILELVNKNPYILCKSPISVDFNKADNIFSSSKNKDDALKIRAALEYILGQKSKSKGHTCLPKEKLLYISEDFIKFPIEILEKTLEKLLKEGVFKKITKNNKDFIYTKEIFDCELYITQTIKTMIKFLPTKIENIDELISKIEEKNQIKYANLQKKAIKLAIEKNILILTGGPGTGKTTTLNAIIKILKQKGRKVFLTAPTGRAAGRLSELTRVKTKTIHRLLEATYSENKKQIFKKNENNLLKCDTLIIDELSMVDIFMFEGILRSLPIGAKLIMVGDEDQLPPVGCGNILADLIKSKKVYTIHLNEIFRQSLESLIVKNAHMIIKGQKPILNVKNSDFFFLKNDNHQSIKLNIVDICVNRLPRSYNFSPVQDIQVICPGKKGSLGTFELNQVLQDAYNPANGQKVEIKNSNSLFREGDKVMQTKNNYDLAASKLDGSLELGVFNGDVGIIKKINKLSKTLTVNFYDKVVKYEFSQIEDLTLSYATTVHKSQGNEFCAVIMPIFDGPSQLFFRKLLYTGVTRAKKLLILIGKENILYKMIENDRKTERYSGLSYLLQMKGM